MARSNPYPSAMWVPSVPEQGAATGTAVDDEG
jgi:hypothetical protein